MPTQGKIDRVSELQSKLEKCSIAVTATYSNIGVNEMTDLRRRTRDAGVEFVVIKNTLMHLAADAANKPQIKEIVNGPTAIAFGYDEPIDVAKTLSEYIRTTRSPLAFQGAVIGDRRRCGTTRGIATEACASINATWPTTNTPIPTPRYSKWTTAKFRRYTSSAY